MVRNHRYDLYLLCDIDLPWQADPLREHPQQREALFQLYQQELEKLGVNYKIIRGSGEQRLSNAISAIEETFR
jgi:nicotinamide riboside kinase